MVTKRKDVNSFITNFTTTLWLTLAYENEDNNFLLFL